VRVLEIFESSGPYGQVRTRMSRLQLVVVVVVVVVVVDNRGLVRGV